MTEKQLKHFYFKIWNRCARAHDWRMEKGRLLGRRQGCYGSHEQNQLYQQVWVRAEQRARLEHRSPTAEDLRHGCHMVALGGDKSAKDLDNRELDRVSSLMRVLTDPQDLDAMMNWLNPEEEERKRLVWAIQHAAPFAYIDTICKRRFDNYTSPFWEDLGMEQLRHLRMTLKERQRAWARKAPQPDPEMEMAPF